jgi:hypothetical protein
MASRIVASRFDAPGFVVDHAYRTTDTRRKRTQGVPLNYADT